jgi:hypothetical protein
METLIRRAIELPGEIERLISAQAEKKDRIYDLIQQKREIEDETAGAVASDRQRYPNEESRRAEIARRLRGNEAYQNLEGQIKLARRELVRLEATAGRVQGELGAANALLNLLAASIHSGRNDVEQLVMNILNSTSTPPQTAQAQAPPETPAPAAENSANAPRRTPRTRPARGSRSATGAQSGGNAPTNDGNLLEAHVNVLEASVNDRGTTRAWCEVIGGQQRVAVYGKNGNGEKLRAAAGTGRTLKVKYRELDAGWFAVAVTAA